MFSTTHPLSATRYHSPPGLSLLKRTHPQPVSRPVLAANVPLPKIAGDVILEVFTHRSLGRRTSSDDYDDNERLSGLGKAALEAILTEVLFSKRPFLRADKLCLERNSILSDENIDEWVTSNNLRKKLRCHPDFQTSLNTPQETRSIFYAYMGGVFSESGDGLIRQWICELIGMVETASQSSSAGQTMAMNVDVIPPTKKIKSDIKVEEVSTSMSFGRQASPHFANPLAPAQPTLSFLPLFNQTATQRRVSVEYQTEFAGPSHAGRWTARCIVNGIPKGMGTGNSKQVAKEEAAREAYYAMGWT